MDNLAGRRRNRAAATSGGHGCHLAFSAPGPEAVDRFYEAALRNGDRDNGAPGSRPDCGPYYYAAYVVDPDGLPIEAVGGRAV